MSSAARLVENEIISRITGSGTFSGVTVRNQENDTTTVSVPNRITVMCSPLRNFRPSRDGGKAPVQVGDITITAKTNGGQSVLDAWAAGIDAVVPGTAGSVQALYSDGGEWQTGLSDQGEITRTFPALTGYTE